MAGFSLKKLCGPAKVYLVVSLIFLFLAIFKKITVFTLLIKGAFVLLWTFVLNYICSRGHHELAWVVLLLPILFVFFTMNVAKEGLYVMYIGKDCNGNNVYGGTTAIYKDCKGRCVSTPGLTNTCADGSCSATPCNLTGDVSTKISTVGVSQTDTTDVDNTTGGLVGGQGQSSTKNTPVVRAGKR